jgi:hypothetical protein
MVLNLIVPSSIQAETAKESTTVQKMEPVKTYTEDGFAINFQITSRWDGAFTANVTIQNTGSKPIQNWALQFSMACNITNIWNGAVYQH